MPWFANSEFVNFAEMHQLQARQNQGTPDREESFETTWGGWPVIQK